MDTIYTLDARGNVFLEVITEHFGISQQLMTHQIQAMFQSTLKALENSGVNYQQLKTALVPSIENNEAAFLFDTRVIQSSSYGQAIMSYLLPLLEPKSTQSILAGDLIASNKQQDYVYEIIKNQTKVARYFEYEHSTDIFCIYLNNITDAALERINEGLKTQASYIGFIPTTYDSPAKTYLSTTLVNVGIKREKTMILAHEDDRPNDQNVNITSYDFEKEGYCIKSIKTLNFSQFLSYKIERKPLARYETDTHFSLNAITENVQELSNLNIILEDKKYDYLLNAGKLIKSGLTQTTKEDLISLIRGKIESSYIYNLSYVEEHDTRKFNIIIETQRPGSSCPARTIVGLEYRPDDKALRVITMF